MDVSEDVELNEGAAPKGGSYGNTSNKLWSVYLSEANRQDRELMESWKGDTEGILIFTGLFAATVAAFIIESYKKLSSDSGAASVLLLNQISQQLSALSNGTQLLPPSLYSDSSFRPTPSAIRVNILWFLSLTLSLVCALAATLMQQWARRYLQLAQAQNTLPKRARTRAYLFEGVQTFRLSQAVEAVPALLHVAVFLFFAGLIDFVFSIDSKVGRVIFGVICFFGGTYILLTFLPHVRPNCPYRTPFSWDLLKWVLIVLTMPVRLGIRSSRYVIRGFKAYTIRQSILSFLHRLRWTVSDAVYQLQDNIEMRALQWALATVDDDDDIEILIEGIPGYLTSPTSKNAPSIIQDLLGLQQQHHPLGQHISRLIQTCIPEGFRVATENVRKRRALICLDTVRCLTEVYFASFSPTIFGFQTWSYVDSLKRDDDPVIAIKAVCTGALAASAYLRSGFLRSGPAFHYTPTPVLFEFVNAPWPKDGVYSQAGCHLVLLQGFISGLLPHLFSDEVAPTSFKFRVVWETLPQILNRTPWGDPEPHFRMSFLALWAELLRLARNKPPAFPSESTPISRSGSVRFTKRVMDADGLPPIEQLMNMLRPTVERLLEQDAAAQEDTQDIQDDATPVELLPTEQVGESSGAHAANDVL